jgi:predicted outer membrane protein
MKITTTLAAALATGSLLVAGALPAVAASPMTAAFVANVQPNIDFLNSASRLALKTSPNARLRAFAKAEATEQTIAGNSLVAYNETNTPRGEAVALGSVPADGPLGPVGTLAVLPLDVATNVTTGVTTGVGDVLTGRSVAIDNPLAPAPAPTITPAAGRLLPSEQSDLDRLGTLQGARFDSLYVATQRDALRQLVTLYTDYAANGDDPALRALAARELPSVEHRLGQLRSL